MPTKTLFLWSAPVDLDVTNLIALPTGAGWNSGKLVPPSPGGNPNEMLARISYEIPLNTPPAGSMIRWRSIFGDSGSPEIWPGEIPATEGRPTATQLTDLAESVPVSIPHRWNAAGSNILRGHFDIQLPGPSFQVVMTLVGTVDNTPDPVVRVQYCTPESQ